MPSYLQIENISKSYGPKILFEHIGFNVNEGDKIALIAPNGTGKTSLLRILAGKDSSDSGGRVLFLKDIRIAFLEQEYDFDPESTVWDQIISDSSRWMEHLDPEHVAAYELKIRQLLDSFSIEDPSMRMGDLSGGEIKRVAIIVMLASEADFYIMDEPTNHLDIEAIEYLESYLTRARCTLLMVTHDRYFLDSVANIVMEIDRGQVYVYKGDYENYLEKRQERIDNYNAKTDKVRNILRRELEWMHASPCARTGKAKSRKNAFYELQDRAGQVYRTTQLSLDEMGGATRLGTKIINCRDLGFSLGGKTFMKGFTYNFQRYERVGIVGGNGSGKTTFINLLTGRTGAGFPFEVTGTIERGESLNIGYYRQDGMSFDEDQTVLETVNDTHLLGRFMFPHDMLNNKIRKLSGGEKRRLYLLTILMRQPNLLVMDEPTNDLDIVTLNVLEEYLKEYKGTLIIVSHDRHFLDRLVDHLLIFMGDGTVKDYVGSYSQYREHVRRQPKSSAAAGGDGVKDDTPLAPSASRAIQANARERRKLTYKEQKEFEGLEKDIDALTSEKAELESKLSGGLTDMDELKKASARFSEVTGLLDAAETRWLELSMIMD
ncbi:MAG: ABC-F family ATP-binding cassette domain-containing protein [Bacteroidales bacterium]|nr:ABC-F family ATP-binding cassette domain-containing protein [Bacteroidales bacterium]